MAESTTKWKAPDEVRPGDHIEWAGRVVLVLDTKPAINQRKRHAGTYLICDVTAFMDEAEDVRQLHWGQNEAVSVVMDA